MQAPRHDDEDHIRDYSGPEAIAKLKELASGICMFTTFTEQRPAPSRPMDIQGVGDDSTLYFFSAASSAKNQQIAADPGVQIYLANQNVSEYLSIYGRATASRDRALIDKYWHEDVKIWFQGGKDDPDLTIISLQPEAIHYWDTKHSPVVALLKMGASLLTGKTMDDGVEGELKV
mgnify:FL=1